MSMRHRAISVAVLASVLATASGLPLWHFPPTAMAMQGLAESVYFPCRHCQTMQVGELKRRFVVTLPKVKDETAKLPVVIVLHGALSNAWSAEFDSGMTKLATDKGFIVVYPYGTGIGPKQLLFWNAGTCCATASSRKVDDVGVIGKMIDYLESNCDADPKRIYVAGASNGGMMAYRLAHDLPERIAAIGSVEGCMFRPHDMPLKPVSIIEFHGTADSIIPYDGGTGSYHGIKVHNIEKIKKTIQYWVNNNHCNPVPAREEQEGLTTESYAGGDGDSAVRLVSIAGGKHVWPGGRVSHLLLSSAGRRICASEAMLRFFLEHPRK